MILIHLIISWSYVLPKYYPRRRVRVNSLRSININVIPSFGHIINVSEVDKQRQVTQLLFSCRKSRPGEPERGLCMLLPKISILLAMPHLVSAKWLNSLLNRSTFMITSKGQGSAGDLASDASSRIYTHQIIKYHFSFTNFSCCPSLHSVFAIELLQIEIYWWKSYGKFSKSIINCR